MPHDNIYNIYIYGQLRCTSLHTEMLHIVHNGSVGVGPHSSELTHLIRHSECSLQPVAHERNHPVKSKAQVLDSFGNAVPAESIRLDGLLHVGQDSACSLTLATRLLAIGKALSWPVDWCQPLRL